MNGINDAVAIVTGGSTGIGRATAERFAERGANVVVADVNVDTGKRTVETIVDDGGEAVFVETDVSNPMEVESMVETTIDAYGGLDFAFNNAGIENTKIVAGDRVVDRQHDRAARTGRLDEPSGRGPRRPGDRGDDRWHRWAESAEMDGEIPDGCIVAMMGRGEDTRVPHGDTVLQRDDHVTFLGRKEDVRKAIRRSHLYD